MYSHILSSQVRLFRFVTLQTNKIFFPWLTRWNSLQLLILSVVLEFLRRLKWMGTSLFSARSGYSPGVCVNKNLFTRLLIRAFSDIEKPFLLSESENKMRLFREGSNYPAAWFTRSWHIQLHFSQPQDIDVASIEPIQSFLSLYIYILLYNRSNMYKGIRSFVLVPWMQRQCPVSQLITAGWINVICTAAGWMAHYPPDCRVNRC